MPSEQRSTANGRPAPWPSALTELDELRARCRRDALVIDALGAAVSKFDRGLRALKAENVELRVENDRVRAHARRDDEEGEPLVARLAPDAHAPAAARSFVAAHLGGLVAPSVLDSATLLTSELVTNGVVHSGADAGERIVLRVSIGRVSCRVEVEDPGCDGVVAPHGADAGEHIESSGRGLNLVHMLSERWGVERARAGGTRVWAQLARAPAAASNGNGASPSATRTAGRDVR
jgi:anti-sigma regulatory factor (Ser/Thr protein kinase)